MKDWIIPSVGMVGSFNLKSPFDSQVISGEKYTCRAVRALADYIANGEDVFSTIYVTNNLTEDNFAEDVDDDMYVVSLQSDSGQWIYLPARYIAEFPNTNGVLYHNVMIGVALGSMPVDTDYETLNKAIRNVVYDALGVEPTIEAVELSQQILVDDSDHETVETSRSARKTLKLSDSGMLKYYMGLYDAAVTKIRLLEDYIKKNM